ncbi:hypothetical protein C8Q80DRAFT_1272349 [Daedaleopsis nitida]|nr:hypothetical protein C8Q80DRAFT_1272349 [Daedaleopsis nitida]
MQYLVSECHKVLATLDNGSPSSNSMDWFKHLCADVYHNIHAGVKHPFKSADYLPDLEGPPRLAQSVLQASTQYNIADTVCDNIILILRQWLSFPNNAQMVAAYFMMYIVG